MMSEKLQRYHSTRHHKGRPGLPGEFVKADEAEARITDLEATLALQRATIQAKDDRIEGLEARIERLKSVNKVLGVGLEEAGDMVELCRGTMKKQKASIAELEAQVPRWHDDGPPEKSGKYIVMFEDGDTGLSTFHGPDVAEWNHCGIEAWCEMPLPAPPEGGEG
jgi:hypothetical protein